MLFLFPLVLAVVGTLFYLSSDTELWTKIVMGLLLVVSLVLQFAVPITFVVPLLIQLVICGWVSMYYQMG
jgi:hypothetical protein